MLIETKEKNSVNIEQESEEKRKIKPKKGWRRENKM
jgi:hypothetical protein